MNIQFLVKDLRVNGANRMVIEYAYGLSRLGWDVKLLVQDQSYPIWLHDTLCSGSLDELGESKVDAVCSTYYTMVPAMDRCNATLRIQLIMDNYYRYGTKTEQRRSIIDQSYYHRNSIKVVVSQYLAEMLRGMGVASQVVHAGIDHDCFHPDTAWRDGTFRVLIEGYPRDYKSLPETYGAIPQGVDIWGLGIDGHEQRATRMWVQPPQDILRKIYSACDVLVKLERRGGFAQAPLEAMACGTPVICSDEGGHLDYCLDRFNSLVASGPAEVSDLIEEIRDDSRLRETLVRNGIATAAAFDWERSCRKLDRLLKSRL